MSLTDCYYPIDPNTGKFDTSELQYFEPSCHRAPIDVFMASIVHRQGYGPALRWMARALKAKPAPK